MSNTVSSLQTALPPNHYCISWTPYSQPLQLACLSTCTPVIVQSNWGVQHLLPHCPCTSNSPQLFSSPSLLPPWLKPPLLPLWITVEKLPRGLMLLLICLTSPAVSSVSLVRESGHGILHFAVSNGLIGVKVLAGLYECGHDRGGLSTLLIK